jgi:hypothetical protein
MRQQHMTLRVVLGAGILLLAFLPSGCSCKPFDVNGRLGGNAIKVSPDGSCEFPDATYFPGEQVILLGRDEQYLAKPAQLTVDPMQSPDHELCALDFKFDKIAQGVGTYTLMVGTVGPVAVTESQLREEVFSVTARGQVDMAMRKKQPLSAD